MTNRERAIAVLRYQKYDRMPVVHFGFLGETLRKWQAQGHISKEMTKFGDGNAIDLALTKQLGFDFNWQTMFYTNCGLVPHFETKVVKTFPDGSYHEMTGDGVVILKKPGAGAIPAHVDHMLKDRASWQEHYVHRYQWRPERVAKARVRVGDAFMPFDNGGLESLKANDRDWPLGLHCGSLYGHIRNVLGIENACYMQIDDPSLFDEYINTVADLCYRNTKYALESGAKFDFAHFWEDICFKNGPLISPAIFAEKVGPHYRRITALCRQHGLDIVSLDCDGMIDSLVPIWFENGVNTMFPIEVGTWRASIEPWRKKYGRGLLGVGGMEKKIFARDHGAIDAEIERLRRLVDLGGYIPCPDHRIADDAEYDNVRYYCDRMRKVFG